MEFAEFRKRLPLPQAFPVSFGWLDAATAKERRFATTFRKPEGTWDFFPEPVANASFTPTKGGRPATDGQVSIEKGLELNEGTNLVVFQLIRSDASTQFIRKTITLNKGP